MQQPVLKLFTDYPTAWRALLALLVVVIFWLALSPVPPKTVDTGWDKANHAAAFVALAFAAVWALWPRPRQWGRLVLAMLALGAAIEIAQGFTPTRQADLADLLADGIGVLAGLLMAWPVTRLAR